jgi:hypothetical protein
MLGLAGEFMIDESSSFEQGVALIGEVSGLMGRRPGPGTS